MHRGGRPSGKHGFWPGSQGAAAHRQLAWSAGQGSGENGLQADANQQFQFALEFALS